MPRNDVATLQQSAKTDKTPMDDVRDLSDRSSSVDCLYCSAMHTHAVRLIDRLNPRTCFLGEGPAIHSQARRRWPLRRPQIQSRVRSLTLSRHPRFFAYNLEAKDRGLRR